MTTLSLSSPLTSHAGDFDGLGTFPILSTPGDTSGNMTPQTIVAIILGLFLFFALIFGLIWIGWFSHRKRRSTLPRSSTIPTKYPAVNIRTSPGSCRNSHTTDPESAEHFPLEILPRSLRHQPSISSVNSDTTVAGRVWHGSEWDDDVATIVEEPRCPPRAHHPTASIPV